MQILMAQNIRIRITPNYTKDYFINLLKELIHTCPFVKQNRLPYANILNLTINYVLSSTSEDLMTRMEEGGKHGGRGRQTDKTDGKGGRRGERETNPTQTETFRPQRKRAQMNRTLCKLELCPHRKVDSLIVHK